MSFPDIVNNDHLAYHCSHNQSCRPSSTGLLDLQEALQKRRGIPVLMMNTDHCDPRAYAEGPMNTRIEGFVELMETYKKRKKDKP